VTHSIPATLFFEPFLHGKEVLGAVQRILDLSGFVLSHKPLPSTEAERDVVIRELSDAPAVFLLFGSGHPPVWLRKSPELLNRLRACTVVIRDEGADWSEEIVVPRGVRYSEGGLADLAIPLLTVTRKLRDELSANPLAYIPLASRARESEEPYEVISVEKEVTILPNGHGYVETTHRIRVLSSEFDGTGHYFGLNEYSFSDAQVPSLSELMRTPPALRLQQASFSYRLLSPANQGIHMGAVEEAESKPRTKVFRFLFSPRVDPGQVLEYAWSWSHPRVFRQIGHDASTLRCSRRFGSVGLHYSFVCDPGEPVSLFRGGLMPKLTITNPVGVHVALLCPEALPMLHGMRFSWHVQDLEQHSLLTVDWTLGRQAKYTRNQGNNIQSQH